MNYVNFEGDLPISIKLKSLLLYISILYSVTSAHFLLQVAVFLQYEDEQSLLKREMYVENLVSFA